MGELFYLHIWLIRQRCHRLNQPANPKKVIIRLSKKQKDVARVMNNKKKLKTMEPQNIGLPSGCKIYIFESSCKNTINICGANVNLYRLVAEFNCFG